MELYQYFFDQRQKDRTFTQRKFAKLLGMNHSRLCAIAHYRSRPSDEVAIQIEEATGGCVQAWELKRLCLEQKKKKEKNGKSTNSSKA